MSVLNKLTSRFKQKDIGDYTSGNPYKHGGHLWCNGIRYIPRDVSALIMYQEYSKQRLKDLETKINEIKTGAPLPCKIGDKVKAITVRSYNNHEVTIHGEVVGIFITKDKKIIRVLYNAIRTIDFYDTDFDKTVFVIDGKD